MSGDFAPRREAPKDVAPTIASRTRGGGGLGTASTLDGGLIAGTLGQRLPIIRPGSKSESDFLVPIASTGDISHCLNAGGMGRQDYESETLVAHSLRADGFDASEDGTGRGTPIVAFDARQSDVIQYGDKTGPLDTDGYTMAIAFDTTQITSRDNRSPPMPGDPCHPLAAEAPPAIAFSAKDHGADAGDISPTLRSGGHDKSHANGGVMPAVASATAVRRLTVEECEKLQGLEPGYTLVPYRGKPASDGPRYKALGNSFAVPVVRWIGERIAMVETL